MRYTKYTKEVHIKRLKEMFSDLENVCIGCPATEDFSSLKDPGDIWSNPEEVCNICRSFVGIKEFTYQCPCHYYGEEEAIKITLEKIK